MSDPVKNESISNIENTQTIQNNDIKPQIIQQPLFLEHSEDVVDGEIDIDDFYDE